jgi:hypothetical protein
MSSVSTGGGGKVAVGMDDEVIQAVSRIAAIHNKNIFFIFISISKYT